jgi:hypothetical protein
MAAVGHQDPMEESRLFMAKVKRGRLDGVWGMRTYASVELYAMAAEFEAQANAPFNTDDPKWLKRWADKVHQLARQKERAREHKRLQKPLQRPAW